MIESLVISYVVGFVCVFISLQNPKLIKRELWYNLFTAFVWPIFIVIWIVIMVLSVYETIIYIFKVK